MEFIFTERVKQLVVFDGRYIFFHVFEQTRQNFEDGYNRFARFTSFVVRLGKRVIMDFLAVSNCRPKFFDRIADSVGNAVGLQYQRENLLASR